MVGWNDILNLGFVLQVSQTSDFHMHDFAKLKKSKLQYKLLKRTFSNYSKYNIYRQKKLKIKFKSTPG